MAKTTIWDGSTDGDFTDATNWTNGVPVSTDTVIFDGRTAQDLDISIAQSAVVLAELHIHQAYTGKIGTTAAYFEIASAIVTIGQHYGSVATPAGSGQIKLDLGSSTAAQVTIWDSATVNTDDATKEPILIICAHANTDFFVLKGNVGIAMNDDAETSTLGDISVFYRSNLASDATVTLGPGVTITNVNQTGGALNLQTAATLVSVSGGTLNNSGSGNITTLTLNGGTATNYSSGAITNLDVFGGTFVHNGTGTITTLEVFGGTVDTLRKDDSRVITNLTMSVGAVVMLDANAVTVTNGMTLNEPMIIVAS